MMGGEVSIRGKAERESLVGSGPGFEQVRSTKAYITANDRKDVYRTGK